MTVLAAVDLGAQSGRVAVGRFDGERLAIDEVHRFANEPVLVRGRAPVGRARACTARCSTGSALAARETGESTRSAVDSWGVDFGLVDARRAARREPRSLPRRPPRRAPSSACSRGSRARELYARTGIQLMPINTVFELGGDGRRRGSGARARRRRSS